MANHKSALKRAKQSEVRRLRNKAYKTRVKTAIKQVNASAEGVGDPVNVQENFKAAVSLLQKTSGRGVIHKNKASRKISRLAKQVNQAPAS